MKFEKVKYPDGTFYARMIDANDSIHTHWINSYEDLFYLMKIKDICNYNKIDPILNIPFMIDGQADKRFNDNESADLKLTCSFLNFMKFKEVRVFHPHNPEVVEMALENVKIIDNSEYINDVLETIDNPENTVLMSTDAGGFKPLMKLADKIGWKGEVFAASKSRYWDPLNEKSVLIQQIDREDFGGKDILIVDDLCVYGGTFIGLYNLLAGKNCGKISLAVSHLTVKKPNKQLEQLHKVYTTNSKFNKEEYELDNLIVFDVNKYL